MFGLATVQSRAMKNWLCREIMMQEIQEKNSLKRRSIKKLFILILNRNNVYAFLLACKQRKLIIGSGSPLLVYLIVIIIPLLH